MMEGRVTIGDDERVRRMHPRSLMMGFGFDPARSEGAIKAPLFQTSTFVFRSAQDGKRFFELIAGLREREPGEDPGLVYSRFNNPDLEILEDRIAVWDEAEAALVFASGMAAIATSLLATARTGETILHSTPMYGGTETLLAKVLPRFGIRATALPAQTTSEGWIQAARTLIGEGTRIGAILVETPANPTNDLVDIQATATAADAIAALQNGARPPVMVDNTLLGPLWQRPLRHGADLVLYSLTKYVGGHSDLVAGAVLGSAAALKPILSMRSALGTMCDPHTGWLLLRSLETLDLRVSAATDSATLVARFLADHPKVERVNFLGSLDPDTHAAAVYARQCTGPGSTLGVYLKGGEAECFRFLDALKLVSLAVSLGGTESLASHPAAMTHIGVPPERRAKIGVTDNLVRISIGVEHPDDLIADLAHALDAV